METPDGRSVFDSLRDVTSWTGALAAIGIGAKWLISWTFRHRTQIREEHRTEARQIRNHLREELEGVCAERDGLRSELEHLQKEYWALNKAHHVLEAKYEYSQMQLRHHKLID